MMDLRHDDARNDNAKAGNQKYNYQQIDVLLKITTGGVLIGYIYSLSTFTDV